MIILLIFKLVVGKFAGQPEIIRIVQTGTGSPFVRPTTFCLFTDFDSFDIGCIREVYVQAGQRRKSFFQYHGGNTANIRSGSFKIGIRFMITQREANRRDSIQTTFEHHSHRTGIMHVSGGVIPMIDTTDYQVRCPVEHCVPCQFDTIGRRSRTFINS